jgi:adenine C2-methylase RlmN of 23S rRNA A2503 and tRNA A37
MKPAERRPTAARRREIRDWRARCRVVSVMSSRGVANDASAMSSSPSSSSSVSSVFDREKLVEWMRARIGDGFKARAHARNLTRACVECAREGAMTLEEVFVRRPALGLPRAVVDGLVGGGGGGGGRGGAFALFVTRVAHEKTSGDGSTKKMIVELRDGHRVEACVMRHAKGRTTLCVSSQVGCKMGCTFCATGTLGELGNLTPGEIVEQLAHASRDDSVRNVVFMGMGEPLNNYASVMEAIEVMRDDKGFGLSASKITVSTVGVIPRMRTLTRDAPGTCLALSLHAPTQELRQKIVPTAKAYKLGDLMAVLDEYLASGPKMKTMIEYCVLGGVNDDETCAEQLGELLRGKEVIVNLIPLNPTDTPAGHVPPKPEAVQKMLEILTRRFGLFTTVRHEMGQDISGACGMLSLKTPGEPDIEDMMAPRKERRSHVRTNGAAKRAGEVTKTAPPVREARSADKTAAAAPLSSLRAERALVVVSVVSAGLFAYSWYSRRSRH